MVSYLLDTDVCIDHLRTGSPVPVQAERAAFSVLTRAELYAGTRVVEAVVDDFLNAFMEVPIDRPVAEEAGRIRRTHGIALADAVIAATSIVTGRTLVTRNIKHSSKIKGLKIHRTTQQP